MFTAMSDKFTYLLARVFELALHIRQIC